MIILKNSKELFDYMEGKYNKQCYVKLYNMDKAVRGYLEKIHSEYIRVHMEVALSFIYTTPVSRSNKLNFYLPVRLSGDYVWASDKNLEYINVMNRKFTDGEKFLRKNFSNLIKHKTG